MFPTPGSCMHGGQLLPPYFFRHLQNDAGNHSDGFLPGTKLWPLPMNGFPVHSPPRGVVVSTLTLAQKNRPRAAKQPPLTLEHSAQWLHRKPMARAWPMRVLHASLSGQGDWLREGHVIQARPTNQRLPEHSEAGRILAGAGCSEGPWEMARHQHPVSDQEEQGQKQGTGGTVWPESSRAIS